MNIKIIKNSLFDICNFLIDILLILLPFCVFFYLLPEQSEQKTDWRLFITFAVVMIFMFYIYDFYKKLIRKKYELLLSIGIAEIVAGAITLIVKGVWNNLFMDIDVPTLILSMMCTFFLLMVWKMLSVKIAIKLGGIPKLLIIESDKAENLLAKKVKYSYAVIYDAWYILIDAEDKHQVENLVRNDFSGYQSIFISPELPPDVVNTLISNAVAQGKEIYVLPDLYNISMMKNEMVQFDDTPALRLKPFGLTKGQGLLKRTFDILVAATGIIVTSPIMLACYIAIQLDSKGPALYRQTRVTENKKLFEIYKFRTMVQNAEQLTGAVLSTEDDPRITKVGKVLRRMRLDELPQLFNILSGSMSVVGPRPERPFFVDGFCETIANYDKRFFTKAGLTGLAQVYARYDTSAKDKTLYDLLYIKDYSFMLDIKLILMTIKVMFVKESSQGVKQKFDSKLKEEITKPAAEEKEYSAKT